MKDQFNKHLIMTEEEEYLFQQSNTCWICKKIIDNEGEKLEIIVILLVNLEVLPIGIVT